MRHATFLCILFLVSSLTGCATHGRRPLSRMALTPNATAESASFSDDISRDIVRQTRHLLSLRETDYMVGPDDVLEVSIFEWEMSEQTKTLEFRVSESGMISLPALGSVRVGGKSIATIQKLIESELSTKGVLQNPRVGVSVKEYRSRRISVIGEVNAPGVYAIHENVTTLMDMLTLAGGPTSAAGQTTHVLRKEKGKFDPVRITVDLQELFDEGKFDLNAVLQGDDIIYVPKAPLIYVYGSVTAPGGYAISRSMRAVEAIAVAGGLTRNADKRACFLVRRSDASGSELVLGLDLYDIERGKDQDVFLREGDIVHVPDSPSRIAGREIWRFVTGIFTFTYRLDEQ
jgi:polysaccharide export outer membrane protein